MPDEEEELITESNPESEAQSVTVDIPVPEPEVVEVPVEVETPAVEVTVEAPENVETVTEGELDRWLENDRRLSALEARINQVADIAIDASIDASEAQAEAVEQTDVVEELLVEAEAAEHEESKEGDEGIEPESTATHPLFASFKDLRERRKNK